MYNLYETGVRLLNNNHYYVMNVLMTSASSFLRRFISKTGKSWYFRVKSTRIFEYDLYAIDLHTKERKLCHIVISVVKVHAYNNP